MPIGTPNPNGKYKANCRKCGVSLSSSTSKVVGLCAKCDVRTSKMGPRR